MPYTYCPLCSRVLTDNACGEPGCGFVHWDNPVPAVAVLVPMFDDGVLLVQRGIEPHKGKWCLPCGFIDPREEPMTAAVREVKEEAGVDLGSMVLLDARCPVPGKTNQIVIIYGSIYVSGEIKAGDDATDARVWKKGEITPGDLAFPLHWDIIQRWINGGYRRLVVDFD